MKWAKGTTFMARILLLEDDPILGKGLKANLETAGHRVTWETTLKSAHQKNESEAFELMILDLNLPDGTGLAFCQQMREKGSRIPILILSARTDEDTVETCFDNGADDYVKKPFSQRELNARIKSALREPALRDEQIRAGPVLILVDQRRVLVDGIEVDLKRREFDIFTYLTRNLGAVVSREKIIEALSSGEDLDDRTVDSHLSHIRSRLKKSSVAGVQILSVYGVGYRLEINAP